MKVLLSSRAAFGHLLPMMPVERAFRDAGHEVMIATSADFVAPLRELGHRVTPAGDSMQWAIAESRSRHPELAAASLADQESMALPGAVFGDVLARNVFTALMPILESYRPDLIMYDTMDLGAALAGALHGIPVVCNASVLAGIRQPLRDEAGPRLTALWAEHSAEPLPISPFAGNAFTDICPPGLRARLGEQPVAPLDDPRRLPLRPVPWSPPTGTVPNWPHESRDRPLVYLTVGTVPFAERDTLRLAIDGLSALDVDVLVATGHHRDPSSLGKLGSNVHLEQFVRQDLVLDKADVVVHHGGSGTVVGALANGVPQLVLPQMADQFNNASAVAGTGAGLALQPSTLTSAAVGESVMALLRDDRYRDATAGLRAEIDAMPSPDEVVAELANLTVHTGH